MPKQDDELWGSLVGGYKVPYDPRPVLAVLSGHYDNDAAWEELWNELHHQGDVGDASYVAVPALVRLSAQHRPAHWGLYGLAATIEEARLMFPRNPPVPGWLMQDYARAWDQLFELALRDLAIATDPKLVTCALAVVALHRKQLALARLALCADDERLEMLERQFGAG